MSFFYYPSQGIYFDPVKYFAQQPEDIYITTEQNIILHGWYFKTNIKAPKGSILFFHGNAENLSSHYAMLIWIVNQGYNLFIFDYPGYGESTGKPSAKSTVESSRFVLQWFQKNTPAPYIFYAHSIGGLIGMKALELYGQDIPWSRIIIASSLDSYQKITQDKMAGFWLTWPLQPLAYVLMSDHYAPNIKKLPRAPILFMHGKKDDIIPYYFSEKMFVKANEPKQIWLLDEANHGDLFITEKEKYKKRLVEYLKN
ncbi:MAG: alpha/beta hydrolase [Pseudobdellovibrionaceae bacterium]